MLVVSLVLAALLLLLLTIRRKANPVAGVPYLSGLSVARQFSKNPATFLSEAHKKIWKCIYCRFIHAADDSFVQ
jgi:hypothetical protein